MVLVKRELFLSHGMGLAPCSADKGGCAVIIIAELLQPRPKDCSVTKAHKAGPTGRLPYDVQYMILNHGSQFSADADTLEPAQIAERTSSGSASRIQAALGAHEPRNMDLTCVKISSSWPLGNLVA